MTRPLLLLAAASLSGCAIGTVHQSPDGDCNARFVTLLKSADEVRLCGASASRTETDVADALLRRLLQTPSP